MTTSTKKNTSTSRVERNGHLRWVNVSDIYTDARAQRELRPGWAAQIAAEFDPDRFLPPLLSHRNHKFYVIDGQHRIEAMRLMGWDDQQVQCWVYDGLTAAQEADLFLWHNNRKAIGAFDKFQIAVVADRDDEVEIDRVVRANGMKVAKKQSGGIGAVTALKKVYTHGSPTLGRTIRIIRDAYGDDGFKSEVIEGIGHLCARYNGDLNDQVAVQKLATVRGGLGALNTKAAALRKQLGRPLPQCVAAAAVDIINAGRGGKKLPTWWT